MILVTGGLGFIGLHCARALLDRGEDVVLTRFRTNRSPSFLEAELGRRAFVEQLDIGDVEQLEAIGRKHSIDAIVHLAVPGRGALGPGPEVRTNLLGLINVLEAAERWGVRRLAVAGSVAVYARTPEVPMREDVRLPLDSAGPTEAFKKSVEILAGHYADRTGLPLVLMRVSVVWGPLYHSMWNLPSRAAHAAVHGTPFEPGGSNGTHAEDGGDLCYVKDCAQAVALLVTAPVLRHRTYNVGDGRPTTNAQVVAAVQKAVPDAHLPLLDGHDPAGPGFVNFEDLTRIREDVGYEPGYDVERGMAEYVAWLRAGNPH